MKKAATMYFAYRIATMRAAVAQHPLPWLQNHVRKPGEQEEKT